MEKRRFVNLDNKTIDPETDLSKKFLNAGPSEMIFGKKEKNISQADVVACATSVLLECKKYLDKEEGDLALAFLINSLSIDSLYRRRGLIGRYHFRKIEDFDEDTKIAISRLRTGLIEEIKKQLNDNEVFGDIDIDSIFAVKFNTWSHNQVSETASIRGDEFYYKKTRGLNTGIAKQFTEYRSRFLDLAQKDVNFGQFSPYVLMPQISSASSKELLAGKRNMIVLEDLMAVIKTNAPKEYKKTQADLLRAVKMVLDFARGCQYIKSKGFVLMDIDKQNIAYDLDEEKGLVFDLDGMANVGDYLDVRLHKDDRGSRHEFKYGNVVESGEMVFQLGVVLDELASLGLVYSNNPEYVDLKKISEGMLKFDARTDELAAKTIRIQPQLYQVIPQLEKIHEVLSKKTYK
ncbi:MAG: hypothetical protein ACD_72C00264G0003 [uncultured bacterium]|nr:MAG: hypothetical protein ACD_72C00264G0003 [uncultured bacterium]